MGSESTIYKEIIPIHVEIWIASRLLSKQEKIFTKKNIKELIEKIFNDYRHGISTHISSCCVANKKSNHPKNYNYLFWLSQGSYKIYKNGDFLHPDKIGCQTEPVLEDIPSQYRYLLDENYEDVLIISEAPAVQIRSDTHLLRTQESFVERINLKELKDFEKEAINKTILMMAYNPSCARIFSEEANKEIKKRIFLMIEYLSEIMTQADFDTAHKMILDEIVKDIQNFRPNNPSGKISYGQAQKGMNVFLKVYVDWANLPSREIAQIIRNYLHCPLDSYVMKTIKRKENDLYKQYGSLPCDLKGISSYEQYINWQNLIDDILKHESRERKRTLIDVVWYLESLKKKEID